MKNKRYIPHPVRIAPVAYRQLLQIVRKHRNAPGGTQIMQLGRAVDLLWQQEFGHKGE